MEAVATTEDHHVLFVGNHTMAGVSDGGKEVLVWDVSNSFRAILHLHE